jgi:hypothetical protein
MLLKIAGPLVASWLLLSPPAWGQYPYYPSTAPAYAGRYGGALYGQADVMRAQGELMTSAEQARVMREQAEQAKLDTKRKAFDEARYERAHTPSYTEKTLAGDLKLYQRVLTKPTSLEVTTGRAMNIMLPYLDRMAREGTYGAPATLDPAQLKMINVTLPGKAGLAMLGDVENIPWPISLVGSPLQEKLQKSLEQAVLSVRDKGRVNVKLYNLCKDGVKELRADVDQKFDREKMTMGAYAECTTFLTSLSKETTSLGDAAAAKLLGGAAHPQGRDVLDLLGFMMANGLQFGPSRPGDESAYFSLHNALAGFGQASQVAARLTSDPTLRASGPPPSGK